MSRRWRGMISQYNKWKNKRRYQGEKKERREKGNAWRENQRLNEENEVILWRTDLVRQSFHKFSFGKGAKHNVNPSK